MQEIVDPVPVGLAARRDWPLDRPMRDRYPLIGTRSRTPVETSGWGVAVIDLLVESPNP